MARQLNRKVRGAASRASSQKRGFGTSGDHARVVAKRRMQLLPQRSELYCQGCPPCCHGTQLVASVIRASRNVARTSLSSGTVRDTQRWFAKTWSLDPRLLMICPQSRTNTTAYADTALRCQPRSAKCPAAVVKSIGSVGRELGPRNCHPCARKAPRTSPSGRTACGFSKEGWLSRLACSASAGREAAECNRPASPGGSQAFADKYADSQGSGCRLTSSRQFGRVV